MGSPHIVDLLGSLEAVIFDLDGTLVDSNDAHAQAWQRAFADSGHRVPWRTIRGLIGMGGDKLIPTVLGISKDSPEGKRIDERHGQLFHAALSSLRPTPGANDLFASLARHGVRRAIATSAKKDEVDALIAIAGVTRYVDVAASASDVEASKPAPDVIEAALAKLGGSSSRVAMVGDAPYDIEAAARAGIVTIALRTGGYSDRDLQRAVVIYDDPRALRRAFDGAFARKESAQAR